VAARVPTQGVHVKARAVVADLGVDKAFCARMRIAIAAGLENAPTGVITTPGTRNPKYVPTKQVVRFSQGSEF